MSGSDPKDCMECRRAMLAEPMAFLADHESPEQDPRIAELKRHAETCEDCARFALDLRGFEDRLGRALRVDLGAVETPLSATVTPLRPKVSATSGAIRRRGGWWAAAASVVLAVAVSATLWFASSSSSLAADVATHMEGEPDAWAVTDEPVPPKQLDPVLDTSRVRLKPGAPMVSYAQICEFRGHRVSHLVVQTDGGPVTVMLLVHENTRGMLHFNEHGYRGIIVPLPGHGSLAVIQRGAGDDTALAEQVAARVESAVEWST